MPARRPAAHPAPRPKSAPKPKAHAFGVARELPAFVAPELAKLVHRPPGGDNWLHEMKYDGYRLQIRIDRGQVTTLTRKGLDWTHKFKPIAAAAARLKVQQAILDGEAVVMKTSGHTDFEALQQAISEGRSALVSYYAFDLLYLDGRDLRAIVLEERKTLLEQLLRRLPEDRLRFSEHVIGNADAFHRKACELKLEGILSKRRNSPYRSERTDDWQKTKCTYRQEFVVGAWKPFAPGTRAIGALLIGHYKGDAFTFAGKVGTGFNEQNAAELMRHLKPLGRATMPFAAVPARERKGANWVEPRVVVEVEFTEMTRDGYVRHPSYKGRREDKDPGEVRLERPA